MPCITLNDYLLDPYIAYEILDKISMIHNRHPILLWPPYPLHLDLTHRPGFTTNLLPLSFRFYRILPAKWRGFQISSAGTSPPNVSRRSWPIVPSRRCGQTPTLPMIVYMGASIQKRRNSSGRVSDSFKTITCNPCHQLWIVSHGLWLVSNGACKGLVPDLRVGALVC